MILRMHPRRRGPARAPLPPVPVLALFAGVLGLAGLPGSAGCGSQAEPNAPPEAQQDPARDSGSPRSIASPGSIGNTGQTGPVPGGGGKPATPLAELDLPERRHDFGQVWEGSVVSHEFQLTASGDEDLSILRVSADCGCTIASLAIEDPDGSRRPYEYEEPVPPGTRFVLRVDFDSRGREGLQQKRIKLFANVPNGMRTVELSAAVSRFLLVEPLYASLGEMSVLDERDVEFRVSSADGTLFGLRHTGDAVPPEVKVHLEPVSPNAEGRARSWEVRAKFGPGLPEGLRSWPVDLETDLENPTAAFRDGESGERFPHGVAPLVHASVLGPVSALPPTLSFGVLRGDEVVAKTVTVEGHDPDFTLPEPTVTVAPIREGAPCPLADTLGITIRPVEGENAWTVEVLLDGLSPEVERSFLARLIIETGHPEVPRLEVSLSGMKQVGS